MRRGLTTGQVTAALLASALAAGCGDAGGSNAASDPPAIVFAARADGSAPGPASDRLVILRLDGVGGCREARGMSGPVAYVASPSGAHILALRDPLGTAMGSVWVVTSDGEGAHEVLGLDTFVGGDASLGWYGNSEALWFQEAQLTEVPPSSSLVRWTAVRDVTTGQTTRLVATEASYDLVDLRTAPDGGHALLRYERALAPPGNARFDLLDLAAGQLLAESTLSGDLDPADSTPRWLHDSSTYVHVRLDPLRPRRAVLTAREFADPATEVYLADPDAQILEFAPGPYRAGAAFGLPPCAYVRRRALPGPVGATVDELVVDVLRGSGGASAPLGHVSVVNELLFDPSGRTVWLDAEASPASGGPVKREVQIFDASTAVRLGGLQVFLDHVDFDRATGDVVVQIETDGQEPLLPQAGLWAIDVPSMRARRLPTPGWNAVGTPRFLRSTRRQPGVAGDGHVR